MTSETFIHMNTSPSSILEGGALEGKTIAIQPSMSVRGWPTEAGSVALEGFVALEDATVIERLRQAGAQITGSTGMSELGLGLMDDTSSRAMAEGRVDIALITDTMGESRVAACLAGVFGYKPSHGIVSRFGLIGLVPSMECYGIAANTLEHIAAVMAAAAGDDDRDLSMPECEIPDFSRICKLEEYTGIVGIARECIEALNADECEAFRAALSRLEEAGAKIKEVSLVNLDLLRAVHNVIGSVEASSSGGKYDSVRYGHRAASANNWNEMYLRSRAESFGLLVKTYLFQGAFFQFKNYTAFENACRIRARIVRKTRELYNEVDVLAFPTKRSDADPATASTVSEIYDALLMTLLPNVTGQPSVHMPGLVLSEGADLGLQLIGSRLNDARLLSVAAFVSELAKGDKQR